jgi:hypothetical protein
MKMAWRAVFTQWSLSLEPFSVFEEIMSAILSRYFRFAAIRNLWNMTLCWRVNYTRRTGGIHFRFRQFSVKANIRCLH